MQTESSEPVIEKTVAVLRRHLPDWSRRQSFSDDADLVTLGLDSMSAINLLLDLEQEFGIEFPDAMLTDETFRTLSSLRTAIQSLTK